MPPRSRKRKAYGIGTRSRFKRRRIGTRRRVVAFSSRRRFRSRRTRIGRRFKRRFRRSRRKNKNSTSRRRHKLEFQITEPRQATFTYGQQHTVPNLTTNQECVYFVTEVYNVAITERQNVITRPLGGIENLMSIGDYAWVNNPRLVTAVADQGWTADNIWGKLFVRGTDLYTLRNQSNETVRITAYYCRCRKDTIRYIGSTTENVYNYLGQGFAENGYNPAQWSAANAGVTLDNLTPRNSRLFCRTFKIFKQEKIFLHQGATTNRSIHYRWRKHTLADYIVANSELTTLQWTNYTKRYAHIKGEVFILFKLHPPIAGVDGQTDLTKQITQTTPTVIMQTQRKYDFKHFPRPLGPLENFVSTGISMAEGSIMRDDDEKKGPEADAS